MIRKQLENMRGADLTKEAKKADGVTSTSILRKIVDFQGVDAERNITTLGRGGTEATAVALARSAIRQPVAWPWRPLRHERIAPAVEGRLRRWRPDRRRKLSQ